MTETETITLKSERTELSRLHSWLEQITSDLEIPPDIFFRLDLCLEEIVSNIIFYAYSDDEIHDINIKVENNIDNVRVTVEDDGDEFNPLVYPSPDLEAPLCEREVGGLGIHLVKEMMDDFHYERKNGKNIVTFTKSL